MDLEIKGYRFLKRTAHMNEFQEDVSLNDPRCESEISNYFEIRQVEPLVSLEDVMNKYGR